MLIFVFLILASTYGCWEYLTYGEYFFNESKPIFCEIFSNFSSDVFFLNLIKISTSASLDNHVPLAKDPPNSNPITSECFSISFSTKSKAVFPISIFDFSKFRVLYKIKVFSRNGVDYNHVYEDFGKW